VPRTVLRLGAALCAIAGCAAPAAPPLDAVEPGTEALSPPVEPEPNIDALEREADQYTTLGRRDLAAPLYARAIELRAPADAARTSDARSLAELAVIEHDRGHLAEAEHFYRRALAAEVEEDGGRDPDLRARTLASLAWLLGERAAVSIAHKHRGEAIDLYQQALEIWQSLQPASDELVAETLANVALVERARGQREKARSLLARALPLYEKTLAPGDPTLVRVRALLAASGPPPPEPDPAEVARALDREGAAYLDKREYQRARVLLERAISIHERGVTAPVELGASLSYLGRTYAALGDRENAQYVLQRSLGLLEPALGKFDPLTLATRASLEKVRTAAPASAETR